MPERFVETAIAASFQPSWRPACFSTLQHTSAHYTCECRFLLQDRGRELEAFRHTRKEWFCNDRFRNRQVPIHLGTCSQGAVDWERALHKGLILRAVATGASEQALLHCPAQGVLPAPDAPQHGCDCAAIWRFPGASEINLVPAGEPKPDAIGDKLNN